jgi:hypothetical protein
MPSQVGSSAMSCVHCVIASTKTRLKKSSSAVTDSPSRMVAVMRGTLARFPVAIIGRRMSGGG